MKRRILIWLLCTASIVQAAGRVDTIRTEAADGVPLYMTAYTPPGYTTDSVYPVLYLLHGIHGNQYSWEEEAHVRNLADSLIGCGRIRPLVIVMPLCVVNDSVYATHIPSYGRCIGDYLRHTRKDEFEQYFGDIETYIEHHYSVVPYAIAGLSSGGRQAALISLSGRYPVVGLFSPVLNGEQLPTDAVGYYWIRAGRGDLFYPCARKANRLLNRRQIPHEFLRTHGCHNWRIWRVYLLDFLLYTSSTLDNI